jgi:hypothetical protein
MSVYNQKPKNEASLAESWNTYSQETRNTAANLITLLAHKYGVYPNDPKVLELAEEEMKNQGSS